jgi:hypothetical protein
VFQTHRGLDRFLEGKDKLTLGVDVAAAAGPVGKRFEASTDLALKAEILSYSNTHGIFAGVSAEGGTLQLDWRASTLYYQQPVTPGAILAVNSRLAVPESTVSLKQMLAEKTAWPERIARSRRPKNGTVILEEARPWDDEPDGIKIDGGIREEVLPDAATERPRAPSRREVRPQAEPSFDEELDSLPPETTRKKAPKQTKPAPPNDEDLPEAIPGPAPTRAKAKAQTKPRPSPKADDDVPDLEAPKTR